MDALVPQPPPVRKSNSTPSRGRRATLHIDREEPAGDGADTPRGTADGEGAKEGPYGAGRAPQAERPRWLSAASSCRSSSGRPSHTELRSKQPCIGTESSGQTTASSNSERHAGRHQTAGADLRETSSVFQHEAVHHAATVDVVDPDFLPPDVELFIADLPMFGACPPALLTTLAEAVKVRDVNAGEDIVRQGDPAPGAVFILRGRAFISCSGSRCGDLPRGSFFGETHLLGLEQNWAVTLSSEVDCAVGELPRKEFVEACEQYDDVAKWYDAIRKGGSGSITDGISNNTCGLLEGLQAETLKCIEQGSVARIFFPGEEVVGQAERNDEVCILVQGRAAVQVAGRSVREIDRAMAKMPPCIGETGLFGLRSPKGTRVHARSVCLVRIVYRTVLVPQVQETDDVLASERLVKPMSRRSSMATPPPSTMPLFQDARCSRSFLNFIDDNLEGRIFLLGQIIADGSPSVTPALDRCMFHLVDGLAVVTEGEKEIATLQPGATFGEDVLFGVDLDSSMTVTAIETCHVEVLHQSVLVSAAKQHPADRAKVLELAISRAKAAQMKEETTRTEGNADEKADLESGSGEHSLEFLTAPFFEGMSSECCQKIISVTKAEHFLPGELITEQGKRGDTMYIMVSGNAGAFVKSDQDVQVQHGPVLLSSPFKQVGNVDRMLMNKVKDMKPGSVFGELALLGVMPKRAATIQAEAFCTLWVVHQADMMSIIKEFQDAQKKINSIVSGNLESTVPGRLQALPLLKDFDQSFRILLSLYSYRRVYFPGERICQGGRPGDSMFVMNVGEADLEKGGAKFMRLGPGSQFGSTLMLGIHKLHVCSVEACTVCHVLVLTRESFLMALERYPAQAAVQALKKSEAKAAEEFQTKMRRALMKDHVFASCGEALRDKLGCRGNKPQKNCTVAKPGTPNPADSLPDVLAAWRNYAHKAANRRRKEQKQAGQWSWWVSGRQVAVQQRMEMERQAIHRALFRDEAPLDQAPELPSASYRDLPSPRPSPLPQSPYLAPERPRRPRKVADNLPKMPPPDMRPIMRLVDQRQADTAALDSARGKVTGPDIDLLKSAVQRSSVPHQRRSSSKRSTRSCG